MAKSSSQRSAKPLYPVRPPCRDSGISECEASLRRRSEAKSIRGAPPSGQRKKAIRQSGGLERAGALPAGLTIFDSAKAQRAAHVIGNDANRATPVGGSFSIRPRSSTRGASGSEPEGWWCEPTRGCHFFCSRSSMYRAPRFERGGCRRALCAIAHFNAVRSRFGPAAGAAKSCRECHPLSPA
jgi:hypothetical protein